MRSKKSEPSVKSYKKPNFTVALIFAAFYIFLLFQMREVYIYYDDFGYLSLSYGYTVEEVVGSDFTLSQMFEFLAAHYSYVSGRLLYTAFFLLSYYLGGLTLTRITVATAVLLALIAVYLIASKSLKAFNGGESPTPLRSVFLALFICSSFGLLPIHLQRSSTYWFSASFLYVVPAFVFLSFSALYFDITDKEIRGDKKSAVERIFCVILCFLAAFSQEQWFAAVVVFTLAICVYRYIAEKKIKIFDIGILAAAFAGGFSILTSPAVAGRMANNAGFLDKTVMERAVENILNVTGICFSSYNFLYVCLLLLIVFLMGAFLFMNDRGIGRAVHFLFLVSTVAAGLYVLINGRIRGILYTEYPDAALWMLFAYILFMSGEILYFLIREKRTMLTLLFIAAFFSVACLVIVPETPHRTLIPFIYMTEPILGYILIRTLFEGKREWFGIALTLLLLFGAFYNMRRIYIGYSANRAVLEYNAVQITSAGERMRAGEDISDITLYILPDFWCAFDQVYQPGMGYMKYWILEYYDCPSVGFDYIPVP